MVSTQAICVSCMHHMLWIPTGIFRMNKFQYISIHFSSQIYVCVCFNVYGSITSWKKPVSFLKSIYLRINIQTHFYVCSDHLDWLVVGLMAQLFGVVPKSVMWGSPQSSYKGSIRIQSVWKIIAQIKISFLKV